MQEKAGQNCCQKGCEALKDKPEDAPDAAPTAAETTAAATAAPTAAPTAAATTAAPIVTTAAPTTAAAPTTTPAPVCPIGSNACPGIDEVNSARGGHNTPEAVFDADLTAEAQAWADQLFTNGVDPSGSSNLLLS